jgi:hypothetical protein
MSSQGTTDDYVKTEQLINDLKENPTQTLQKINIDATDELVNAINAMEVAHLEAVVRALVASGQGTRGFP